MNLYNIAAKSINVINDVKEKFTLFHFVGQDVDEYGIMKPIYNEFEMYGQFQLLNVSDLRYEESLNKAETYIKLYINLEEFKEFPGVDSISRISIVNMLDKGNDYIVRNGIKWNILRTDEDFHCQWVSLMLIQGKEEC